MKKTYITHVTRDYLDVAINLAKSIELFSKIPLVVYCIGLEDSDKEKFNIFKNVELRNIELDIKSNDDDYVTNSSGNFYINRNSTRIYQILCAKTIAMEMALEEGFDEVCYLDSDCLATPFVDELFDWTNNISDFPIATEGIHEYMIIIENGIQKGNPFINWPIADNTYSLEWPLMNFMQMKPEERGRYRTTGIMLMNQNCLPFIRTWRELCFLLPKLVDTRHYAPYHEETIYNVLSWKKENKGFPLCYINLGEGLETVKHFYSDESVEGNLRWSDTDTSQNFYKIPDDKKYVKVLHGEKRTSEVESILDFLNNNKTKKNPKILIQIDTFADTQDKIEITKLCIESLKDFEYPILLTSHIDVPDEIKDLCDYSYIDNNNVLLPPTTNKSFLRFYSDFLSSEIILNNSDPHAPACLSSIINGARFAINNNFDFFIRFEYDVFIKEEYKNYVKDLIKSSSKMDGLVFYNNNWLDGKIIMIKPELYLKKFDVDINSSDDYYNLLSKNGVLDDNRRHLQNTQYKILNDSGLLNNVNKIPTRDLEDLIDNRLSIKESGVFRPVYIEGDESSFANICHGWIDGDVKVDIYLDNVLIYNYIQKYIANSITYRIFQFENKNYKIISTDLKTNKVEIFEFSNIQELKNLGKLILN